MVLLSLLCVVYSRISLGVFLSSFGMSLVRVLWWCLFLLSIRRVWLMGVRVVMILVRGGVELFMLSVVVMVGRISLDLVMFLREV